jgi:hypothetical protein
MSFVSDFQNCITGKNLPAPLAQAITTLPKALKFASKVLQGLSVEEALIAIGVGAAAAAEIGEAVAATAEVMGAAAAGIIAGAVVGCAVNAASNREAVVAFNDLESDDQSAVQGALADAGVTFSDEAVA